MAIKRYEVVLFPDRASKATFLRVQTQALRGELASSYLFLTVVELVEFLCVSISNDCSHELFKKQILDEENIFIHWMEVVSTIPPKEANGLQTVAHALGVGYEKKLYWQGKDYLPLHVTKDYFETVIEEVDKTNNIWITKECAINKLISCKDSINISISSVKLYGFRSLPPLLISLFNAISAPYKELEIDNPACFFGQNTPKLEQKKLLRNTSYDIYRLDSDSIGNPISAHSKSAFSNILLEFRAVTLYVNILKVSGKLSPVQDIISIISSPLIPGFNDESKLRLEYCRYINSLGISEISLYDITKIVRCPQILALVLSIFLTENNNQGSQHFLYEWMTAFSKSISLLFRGCGSAGVPEDVSKCTDVFSSICYQIGKYEFKVRKTCREKALEFLEAHALNEMKRAAPQTFMDNPDLLEMNVPLKPERDGYFDASSYSSNARLCKNEIFLFLVKSTINLFWKKHRIQKELLRFTIEELETELNIYLAKQIENLFDDEPISILFEKELGLTVINCCIDLLKQDMQRKPFMVEWVNLECYFNQPLYHPDRVHERLDVEMEAGAYTKEIYVKYHFLGGIAPDGESLEAPNVSYKFLNQEQKYKVAI